MISKLMLFSLFVSISNVYSMTEYQDKVKPLIQKNCLSCHGNYYLETWYRELPIAKQIINYHIQDAKKHLDMRDDSFFKSKGSQSDIYWSIAKSIESKRMPPNYFSIFHSNLKFNEKDQLFLINWFKKKSKELSDE
tara:strand:- start:50612 stop:51019 length:408 start_codon:yes stop_codon:yes gene_type:complete